ncbi:MAG: permease prefix domain 1-containing protein [Oscillospiraceae bacterium]|nr:permease prefix domain 1-containing protein [Oscillospiraceae bacterium]
MGDRTDAFLDRVCAKVKNRAAHKYIRGELVSHIDEAAEEYEGFNYGHEMAVNMALSRIGNAEEIGEELNRCYRMPFGRRCGFVIWAALVTALIYLMYPIVYKIYNYTMGIKNVGITVLCILAVFAAVNILFLRRGMIIWSIRSAAEITLGFLIGYAAAVGGLMIASRFYVYGYYPYFTDVKILAAFPYVPFIPKKFYVFGMESFCWWACLMMYLASLRNKRKTALFSFAPGLFSLEDGQIIEDDEFIALKRNGKRISNIWLKILRTGSEDFYWNSELKRKDFRL